LRSVLVTLDVPGAWPSPAFTPAEPVDFLTMFDEVLQRRRPPETQS
jgi:hypothetical protein